VAVLAILGLIPLWAIVYRTYADLGQPTPTPGVTPVITPVSGTAIVPQLVGLTLDLAQEEVARANLGLIVEERDATNYPVPTVLEQDPSAGQTIPSASQIKLIVSRSLPSSAVPDVWGFTLDEVRDGLQSRGWLLAIETVWSSDPSGRIVSIEPPVGTMLAAGETLTLTLSAGTDQPLPLEVNLNNTIFLQSAQISSNQFSPGASISCVLRWRALQPVADSYTVFFHLLGPDGRLVTQDDHEPLQAGVTIPTNGWTPGVFVSDTHNVTIPDNAVGGVYQLRAGMYLSSDSSRRLPVIDTGRTSHENHSVLILEIQVGP
jgi:serine/threonine-protein kinase